MLGDPKKKMNHYSIMKPTEGGYKVRELQALAKRHGLKYRRKEPCIYVGLHTVWFEGTVTEDAVFRHG